MKNVQPSLQTEATACPYPELLFSPHANILYNGYLYHRGRMKAIPSMLFAEKKIEKRKSVYAAALCAAPRIPAGKPGEDRRKTVRGRACSSRRFDGWIRKRTPYIIRFQSKQAHIVNKPTPISFANRGQGDKIPLLGVLGAKSPHIKQRITSQRMNSNRTVQRQHLRRFICAVSP